MHCSENGIERRMAEPAQPWKPGDATQIINRIVRDPSCRFSYTVHVKERMAERNIVMSDLLFALKNGNVYDIPTEADQSTIPGYYKYKVECQTPNSGSRTLRVVAVPDSKSCQIKVITIMWRDES